MTISASAVVSTSTQLPICGIWAIIVSAGDVIPGF